MNVIELKKALKAILLEACPRVHYEDAPKNETFPYIVFVLSNSIDINPREDFQLEVDVWDKPGDGDTTEIETIVGNIDGDGDIFSATGLNKRCIFIPGKVSANVYRTNRLVLPDPDERIRRRQLRYTVKAYL